MKKLLTFFVILQLSAAFALEIFPAGKKYIYRIGEDIIFKVKLDKESPERKIKVRIAGNSVPDKEFTIEADKNGDAEIRTVNSVPGFVYVEISNGGKKRQEGVAVEPEKIIAGRPFPEKFDTYWDAAKKELDLMPLTYQISELPKPRQGYRALEVKVDMGGEGKDLFAVLTMPTGLHHGRLAAEVVYHGAGTDKVFPIYRENTIVLSVNPMSVKHDGPPSSTIRKGKFRGYPRWGAADLQKNYFPGMFRRVFRALQFIKSLPEWDHRTLIVRGISQGGGQALVAAGLDPQVTLCIAAVPALCDHGGNLVGRVSGWPRYYTTTDYKNSPDKAAEALDMIDAVFFAAKIKNAKVLVTVGFIDRVCVGDSVYAAYNAIPSPDKQIANDFMTGHTTSRETKNLINKLIIDHISKKHEIFK